MKTRAELKQVYLDTPVPMGVFLVRNTRTNQFVLGASRNLAGSLNRYRFMLQTARPGDTMLKSPALLVDFRGHEESFEFQALDTLEPKKDAAWDPTEDLKALEAMWLKELLARGWTPY